MQVCVCVYRRWRNIRNKVAGVQGQYVVATGRDLFDANRKNNIQRDGQPHDVKDTLFCANSVLPAIPLSLCLSLSPIYTPS